MENKKYNEMTKEQLIEEVQKKNYVLEEMKKNLQDFKNKLDECIEIKNSYLNDIKKMELREERQNQIDEITIELTGKKKLEILNNIGKKDNKWEELEKMEWSEFLNDLGSEVNKLLKNNKEE